MATEKTWFVTGASKGLGLTLVKRLLKEGYKVAATSRSRQSLEKEAGKASANFLPLEMDLMDEKSIQNALADTINQFGKIDVVVNNAGYGQMGTLEELSSEESKKNFDVNVFGLLNVIRNVMPHLRGNRSGHIFNISSIGGYTAGFSGWGIYCATKFAVSGLTESLAAEVKSFGIHVTLVYPGYFRTNFLSQDSMMQPAHPIADYTEARQSQTFHINEMDGNQAGDPEKLAGALITVAGAEQPPLHLFLGSDAVNIAGDKMASVKSDLEKWKSLSVSTDFK